MIPRQVCTDQCSDSPQCRQCGGFVEQGPGFGSCPYSQCGNFYQNGDDDLYNPGNAFNNPGGMEGRAGLGVTLSGPRGNNLEFRAGGGQGVGVEFRTDGGNSYGVQYPPPNVNPYGNNNPYYQQQYAAYAQVGAAEGEQQPAALAQTVDEPVEAAFADDEAEVEDDM